jgi:multidrug efflux pump subunit AcrA (membrane-fusion protein)
LAESEKDLNVSQKNQQQIKLQFKQLEAERVRQRREEEGELAKLRFQIESLKRQLSSCDGDTLVVRAPFRAVVIAIAHRNSGAIIQKGDELCQLARVEGSLRARLFVQETGVSHLAPGQKVRFFFDAFPYQRYGTLSGEFEWLSPAAVGSGAGAQFIGRATLDRLLFQTKFEKRPLRAGMRGEARVIVGKRNFIEYVFEPIKQLREQTRI